ncbi:hypothetical protein BV20DRAFT_130709 [Pilatotrama ljubarskyi]|nr:hypothetical protein BV20DRAFT_130709 [Pilatotrama ljubarskyi]
MARMSQSCFWVLWAECRPVDGFCKGTLYLSFTAVCFSDVLIAVSSCALLARQYRTALRKADSLKNTLMLYSSNTGAFATSVPLATLMSYPGRWLDSSADNSVCAIGCLITYATVRRSLIYIRMLCTLPKVPPNSLLASHNVCKKLRDMTRGGLISIPLTIRARTTTVSSGMAQLNHRAGGCTVTGCTDMPRYYFTAKPEC